MCKSEPVFRADQKKVEKKREKGKVGIEPRPLRKGRTNESSDQAAVVRLQAAHHMNEAVARAAFSTARVSKRALGRSELLCGVAVVVLCG